MIPTEQKQTGDNLAAPVTYTVRGREFIVEPVYNEEALESMGEILLKIIISGNGKNVKKD